MEATMIDGPLTRLLGERTPERFADLVRATIRGRVLGAAGGRPIPRAAVSAEAAAGSLGAFGWTDGNGSFAFRGAPPGAYRLRVSPQGSRPVLVEATVPAAGDPAAVEIRIGGGSR